MGWGGKGSVWAVVIGGVVVTAGGDTLDAPPHLTPHIIYRVRECAGGGGMRRGFVFPLVNTFNSQNVIVFPQAII